MALPPDYVQMSASDKMAVLWKNIKETEFDPAPPDAPKPVDPDPWVSSNLLNPVYLHATFEHSSDELPKGRVRLIHTYGRCALACVQVVGKQDCMSDFASVMGATTLDILNKHSNYILGLAVSQKWSCSSRRRQPERRSTPACLLPKALGSCGCPSAARASRLSHPAQVSSCSSTVARWVPLLTVLWPSHGLQCFFFQFSFSFDICVCSG